MWKTASASPTSGGRPRLVADHTHKEFYKQTPSHKEHKDRTGGDVFFLRHIVFLGFKFFMTAQDKRVAKGSARKAPASQTRYH